MHRILKTVRPLCVVAALFAAAFAIVSSAAAPAAAGIAVHDLGPVSRTALVRIVFALNYRREDELEALIAASSDPNSPEYGRFLSPQQFDAAFAPTAATYERVAATLARAGFAVSRASASIIDAVAPAPVVERFFGTELHAVKQDGVANLRYLNVTPASLPPALRAVTYGVAGLDDLIVARTASARGMRRVDLALGPPLQGPDTGLSPWALASAYDLPVQHARPGAGSATFDGTGHAAGVAIDSDLFDSDLAAYLAYFNIVRTGPPLARRNVDGGAGGVGGDVPETALDVELISSLAPGAAVVLYLMPELSTSAILDTYNAVVKEDKVDVLNSSFGGCESSNVTFAKLTEHVAKQGVAEGITFSASTGDSGADECDTGDLIGVSAPASGPHFTAVGGTTLLISTAAQYRNEFAWVGSGGGVSTVFARPSYQNGIKHVLGTTRNLPDIAFDGDPNTGVSIYYRGFFEGPEGGTSVGSPIFCALVTERNEMSGKRSGLADTGLYADFKNSGYGVWFRDIIYGNNSFYNQGYDALPGYDLVTGIGSPIGYPHAK